MDIFFSSVQEWNVIETNYSAFGFLDFILIEAHNFTKNNSVDLP